MKLRNKLIATIVSISMVLAVIGVGAWASTESFTATITNTVSLEFDNIKGQISVMSGAGADNVSEADGPEMESILYDGSNVVYGRISSSATNGTNLYWRGTQFLDGSDDGLGLVNSETEAAVLMYAFIYMPTEDCVGSSTITAMITETSRPEISGGKLLVKYFVTVDEVNYTEITSGEAITPIADNEAMAVVAACQYYNLDGESISTLASAWDFNVTFSAGRNSKTALDGSVSINPWNYSSGVVLPPNYTSLGESRWEIIEFGEYPQTLKANNVTITSNTPDADGYYPGSDGERYAKLTAATYDQQAQDYKLNVAADGTTMVGGQEYYFKVEPIKWRVLLGYNGQRLLMSDMALDAKAFQTKDPVANYDAPAGTNRNNYEYSEIRQFLNGDFYAKSFSDAEKQQIVHSTIPNDNESAGGYAGDYAGGETQDYVFLPSYMDVTNDYYGFKSDVGQDTARAWKVTDYAKAAGVESLTSEFIADNLQAAASSGLDIVSYKDCAARAWTRSATTYERVSGVIYGFVSYMDLAISPGDTNAGVVPMLIITE